MRGRTLRCELRRGSTTAHRLTWCAVLLLVALGGTTPNASGAEDPRLFAVHIDRTPKQPWPGYGIYLGDGLVITASHVVGEAALTKPNVVIDELALPVHAIKEGSLDSVDLTLLSIEPRRPPAKLEGQRLALCEATPEIGTDVIVAIPEGMTRTRIVSAAPFPLSIRMRFGSLIANVQGTGNSGSGVFDAKSGCLLGIVSRKLTLPAPGALGETSDKYFVPANTIRDFIPENLRF